MLVQDISVECIEYSGTTSDKKHRLLKRGANHALSGQFHLFYLTPSPRLHKLLFGTVVDINDRFIVVDYLQRG